MNPVFCANDCCYFSGPLSVESRRRCYTFDSDSIQNRSNQTDAVLVGFSPVTHTERVLYVDEPAIKAVALADLDQFIGHRPVRLLVFQEGLTLGGAVGPLRDEGS